ncbi:Alpha/Beta hydrolase protein [Coniella lustricola]|uniref:Carboxylic ester hydrolase n=1 Tax=Coniella lustricola TaxID=2025994 RepID=A0A2T2ZWB1_9PEZI|nr:Alpha/Beta hydrolase protein [Coniella lustricola]
MWTPRLVSAATAGILLLTGPIATATTADANSTVPIIDLGYVKYAGYTNTTAGINYYRGIPYAQPPTGENRWQKPIPIENSTAYTGQTIQATTQAPACIQGYPSWQYASDVQPGSFAYTPQGQSEDCLIVDVLVPSDPQNITGGLSVVVQIHGGGYTTGSALSYPGDSLVHASSGGIIYVAMQYRLGVYGFLAGAEVAENGVQNAGLYDQRLALDWVQRHVAAFGGDPAKVTIWGGSAGGGSVTYQLMAGGGAGTPPFRAAIPEYPWWQPLLNKSTQELQYRLALDAAGCADIACLRGLSAAALTEAGQADFNQSYPGPGDGYGTFWFGPVVDGEFLLDLPDIAFKKGAFFKVPILTDREGYEGVSFSNSSVTNQVEETADAEDLFPSAGPGFFSRLYELYPASDYNSTYYQRASWYGDFIISCPTYQIASSAVLAELCERWRRHASKRRRGWVLGAGHHVWRDQWQRRGGSGCEGAV